MGRPKRSSAVRKKTVREFPQIFVDIEADFASIKLAPGIETKSYEKDGFVFCEDQRGRIIEIQVLNLGDLKRRKERSAA